jgi:carboxymethylenebutenolidase
MNDPLASVSPDRDSEALDPSFSRRGFLVTSLAAGLALATHPVMAQTMIHTPATGLDAGEVKIPIGGVEIPAYYAVPKKSGRYPVILVVQEIFGVHEHIKDVCRRLAHAGYFAVAGVMFARQGDVSQLKDIAAIRQIVAQVPDAQVMSDLDAITAWADRHPQADASKLGITGFCWGGRIVWLYAAHNPKLNAAVAWYGRLVGQDDINTPSQPIDLIDQLKAPVLGLYGGADKGIPVESVERMRAAMQAQHKPGELIIYPDTPHAFNADYRPSYRKQAAEDGWKRMLAWFKQNGL